jgi:iron complex transport system permease protein
MMRNRPLILRFGPIALAVSPVSPLVVLALLVLVLAVLGGSISIGAYPIAFRDLLPTATGRMDAIASLVLMDYRLPRLLAGAGVGAALGVGGMLFQTMLRNPLATPDLLGFNAGATCGAIAVVAFAGSGISVFAGALVGGFAAAFVVGLLAWNHGLAPERLILTGLGITLVLSAIADLQLSRLDSLRAAEVVQWLVGTLRHASWTDVKLIWGGLLLLSPLLALLSFALARLSLEDDVLTGIGINLAMTRFLVTVAGIILVALAVSVAGPLPFVAFAAGPIARRLLPAGGGGLLVAGLIGALMVLLADLMGRTLLGMYQLPAGIFTALVGAPVLLWLLISQIRKEARQ